MAAALHRLEEAFDPDEQTLAAINASLLAAVRDAASRVLSQLPEAPDEAVLKAIQAELEDVFKSPTINRELYAAWLTPYLLWSLLAGMADVQAEAAARVVASTIIAAEPGYQVPGFQRPEEAIAWFREKGVVSYEEFKLLDAAAKARAFSCAKLSDNAALEVVKDSLQDALERGIPPNTWLTSLEETFADKGIGLGATSDYWRLVHDQNTSLALGAGRYVQTKRVADSRPYLLYWNPAPVTDLCVELEGKVFRQDDPAVDQYWPPNHFRCKSQFLTLDADELAEEGLEPTTTAGLPPPSQGFDFNPADAFFLNAGIPGLAPTPEGKAAKETLSRKTDPLAALRSQTEVTRERGVSAKDEKQIVEAVGAERQRLLARYPQLANVEVAELRIVRSELRGAVGDWDDSTRQMRIKAGSASSKAREMAQRRAKARQLACTATDAENIYRHELGHAAQTQLLTEEERFKMRDEFLDANEGKLARQVSKYAATEPEEAFSEMFNLMASGRKTRFDVLPETQAAIRRILG